jgi:phospholipid/cholesterol/gamma-HCH transport system substrate-binding protein
LKINKEVKVAVFVIIAGTMLYTGFNFLKGIDFLNSTNTYYVKFSDVAGLQVSNSVILNGLTVGRVSDIEILDDSAHTLKVSFEINKKIKVGEDAKTIIASPDLLGGKALLINVGDINKPAKDGSYLKGEVEKGFADKIGETTAPIVDNIQISILKLNQLLAEENIKNLSNIISNLEKTSAALNKLVAINSANLNATTANIKNLTASLVETEKQLKPILEKINLLADTLNKAPLASTITHTNEAISELQKTLTSLNQGNGTLGKLITNDSLYTNLNNTARDLDLLLIDLKNKPSRYVQFSVFGKKDKK